MGQDFGSVEPLPIRVVDDCSTEESWSVIEAATFPETVHFSRHSVNKGLSYARNTGIENTNSLWLAFCDDDDYWPKEMASNFLQVADKSPQDVGVILGLPENRRSTCESFFDGYPTIKELLLAGITPPVSSQMYKREVLVSCKGYDTDVRSGVDHGLWINLASTTNPRVAVAWGSVASVGSTSEDTRLTTNEVKRRTGIDASLKLWKEKIELTLGPDFYQHFVSSYKSYLDVTFFVLDIRNRAYRSVVKKLANPKFVYVFSRYVISRLLKKCNLFPSYRPKK